MPIYEFICDQCENEFEELVFGNDMPTCPHCQSSQCQKLISRPCVHHTSSAGGDYQPKATSSSSKCAGCSGKSCATCH